MTDFSIMQAIGNFVDSVPGLKWINARASMEQFSHTIVRLPFLPTMLS